MKIKLFDIQNFRKLKDCRIELSDRETVFVGANNSGKTSAMDALIHFLVKARRKEISTTDFTLSNWRQINKFADSWVSGSERIGLTNSEWYALCPTLDVWLEVEDKEIYYVGHLIPTLNWTGGLLGVRLIFAPKDIEELQKEYIAAYSAAKETIRCTELDQKQLSLNLWPRSMRDFLERKLHSKFGFGIQTYLLNPDDLAETIDDKNPPQKLLEDQPALEIEPFDGLFRIDLIEAQRGFSDAISGGSVQTGSARGNLSQQLRDYYRKHLDPLETPDSDDLDALQSLEKAQSTFDVKLKERFQDAINEIEGIGYPGFTDPTISLTSKINPIDSLDHPTAIQFDVFKQDESSDDEPLRLPEKLNGLGYKNLISMIFTLIEFRDGWMRVGKASKTISDDIIEPLHLVLVEEPEAHLHAQVQQVFIKKAYDVLRNHAELKSLSKFTSQLVVSTHSSYLAHEVDFAKLRYFRREPAISGLDVPSARVINLSDTFGDKENETAKFVARYLKTTHCDLFFANGVLIVEGAAERMLIPHFIRTHYDRLNTSYISILEINGAHAHKLRPLIEKLGLHTLVISDLDSLGADKKKTLPDRGRNLISGNDTLKKWLPQKEKLDEILDASDDSKVNGNVRVAYQCPISIDFGNKNKKSDAIPYTFEDSLVLSNIETFRSLTNSTGMLNKMVKALGEDSLEKSRNGLFDALSGEKAKMAMDILFDVEPEKLNLPKYIDEGLIWLENELGKASLDLVETTQDSKGVKDG